MTEFELKSIEFMESERLINVYSLLQGQSDLLASDMTSFSTVLFGYLIVAYFIGAHLTRVQLWILNTLYVVTTSFGLLIMLANVGGLLGHWNTVNQLSREVGQVGATSSGTVNTVLSEKFLLSGLFVPVLLVLASLYFMWSIRHPNSSQE